MNDLRTQGTSPREREVARVRAHLENAERIARSHATDGLSEEVRARRETVLENLRRYIEEERYPINRVRDEPTPVFVDEGGARCAMAALLEATGDHDLVARVARTANLARVKELAHDEEFAAWLARHGVTVDEAATIQPAYHAHLEADWRPTLAVFSGAYAGSASGLQVSVATGVRFGLRREERGSDSNGASIYGSLALTLEYARSYAIGVGGTNQLGVLLQWEPHGNHRDAQWYLMGGPLASVDEDDAPGHGFGGQLGAGFSFRRRPFPMFAEVVGQGLGQSGPVLRLGIHFGAVW